MSLLINYNDLGENEVNLKYLREGMKQLPCNLENLELGLIGNKIGENYSNLKYLGQGIK